MKKIIIVLILTGMLQNCNSQERTDLQKISDITKTEILTKKELKPTEEKEEYITKLPAHVFYDQQIEHFKFGDILLKKKMIATLN